MMKSSIGVAECGLCKSKVQFEKGMKLAGMEDSCSAYPFSVGRDQVLDLWS